MKDSGLDGSTSEASVVGTLALPTQSWGVQKCPLEGTFRDRDLGLMSPSQTSIPGPIDWVLGIELVILG